jgi:hypothetical protein
MRTTSIATTTVMTDYKRIAEEFCLEYYKLYDDNVEKLKKMYHPDSKFVYFDHEFAGFDEWFKTIKYNNFIKFTHMNMSVNVIPVSELNLLMTIIGTIYINNTERKFTENIMLQKDNYGNNFLICTTMFKLIE